MNTELTILVYISDACNFKCSYCYNRQPRSGNFIDIDILLNFLAQISEKTGRNIKLSLIGGEPSLHPKVSELVTRSFNIKNVCSVDMYTNLSVARCDYAELLSKNVKFSVSWHTETNDTTFVSFLNGLTGINQANIIEIAMMYEFGNSDRWGNVIYTLKEKYKNVIVPWLLYKPSGVFQYSDDDIRNFSSILIKNGFVDVKKHIGHKDIYKFIFDDFSAVYMDDYSGNECTAGVDTLYIHVNGDVYPCQNEFYYGDKPLYNIKDGFDVEKYTTVVCKCPFCRHGNFGVTIGNGEIHDR